MAEKKPISEIIRTRIKQQKKRFFANDNISEFISSEELELLKDEIAVKFEQVLKSLIIDTDHDYNTQETAQRVAKMYVDEIYWGRYHPMPEVTIFPNKKCLEELYVLGPIRVLSSCSHHFVPIIGRAWIGILPSSKIIGISKFNRIIHWVMSRPHIQEEAAIIVADFIQKQVEPKGLAVIIQAKHYCMYWRGVKDPDTVMTNSIMRGLMKDDAQLRNEFLNIVAKHPA